jgi:Transposase
MLEVIAMVSRAYRATRVNDVDWNRLARGNEGLDITLGIDVGKRDLWPVCRWASGRFERPWRVKNPEEIPTLITLIQRMSTGRKLVTALESSGTYGDALRQALSDAKIAVMRVSNKASHDYAEIFDGVPSQHDGKDAAVIAELAALGKAQPWAYEAASDWEQELSYWVEWMVVHRADPGNLAGATGGAGVAALAGGDAGAEARLGDVAAGIGAPRGPQGLGRGRGSRAATVPMGWIVPGDGKSRAAGCRCGLERGRACR